MARWPSQYTNINGIPAIQSRGIKVTDTAVEFKFNPDWDSNPFRGIILVYLADAVPQGTTTTLPVTFTMAGRTENVTTAAGSNWTVADIEGTGIYLFYYDRLSSILQILN